MASLTQNGSSFGQANDPNTILNECREIDNGILAIENNLELLEKLQQRVIDDPDSSATSKANNNLNDLSTETMDMYRNFAGRIKAIKQQPESGSPRNASQLGKVDRRLKTAINRYQVIDVEFRRKLEKQFTRQYKIVRPDASEDEIRDAAEDTSNQQVFSQALLQSSQSAQAKRALNAVQNRHAAIQKIESQMIELAQLFQDMEQLVVQQEAAVVNIEMKGEEVVENMDKGTQEIGTAIKSARNARKWKWWCLGIVGMFNFLFAPPKDKCSVLILQTVLIIIIIVVVVLIYKFVIQNNNPAPKTRRSLADTLDMPLSARRVMSGHHWSPPSTNEKRMVVPGLKWDGNSLATERRRKIKFEA